MNSIFLLLEIMSAVLGPQGRRRLELRQMGNDELFKLYDNESVLRLHNKMKCDIEKGWTLSS